MRPLLLGMNDPSGSGEPLGLSRSGAGTRLLSLSGLSREEYEETFERANLLPGRVWRPIQARLRGARLREELARGRTIVVLGKETWAALGLLQPPPARGRGTMFSSPIPVAATWSTMTQ